MVAFLQPVRRFGGGAPFGLDAPLPRILAMPLGCRTQIGLLSKERLMPLYGFVDRSIEF